MRKSLLQETYPVFTLELNRDETTFDSVDAIVDYLSIRIGEHPVARYLTVFDHYDHTRHLGEGEIAPEIRAAKNIVFCFGTKLPDAQVMAVRPRSIGVVDLGDRFVVTFMEAPMQPANQAMETWAKSLKNR